MGQFFGRQSDNETYEEINQQVLILSQVPLVVRFHDRLNDDLEIGKQILSTFGSFDTFEV